MSILKNLLNKVVDAAIPETWVDMGNRLINEDFMKAFTGCFALVVCADGVVEESETEKVREYIRTNLKFLKGYDVGRVMQQFNDYVNAVNCDFEEGRGRVYKVLQEIKGKTEASKTLIRICCKLAEAGGDFNEAEKNVIKEICEKLNVDYKEFREIS